MKNKTININALTGFEELSDRAAEQYSGGFKIPAGAVTTRINIVSGDGIPGQIVVNGSGENASAILNGQPISSEELEAIGIVL